MKEQIHRMLRATPFVPFLIEVADEVVYSIATVDHVLAGARVLAVLDDQENVDVIPYEHIRRLRFRGLTA